MTFTCQVSSKTFFFFINVEEIRTDTRPLLGWSGVIVPDSNRLKPPRWPSRLRSREAREPVWATPPPAYKMHHLMKRHAVTSSSLSRSPTMPRGSPRSQDPECGDKSRDTSGPAIRTGEIRRAPPPLPPKWCGNPSLHWWPRSCAASWPLGDCDGWPSDTPPRSGLRRGASIAPRRRTAGALRRRARLAKTANILMHSPSSRQMVPGTRSERRSSSDCRGSGSDTSCWFRPRSQSLPTSGDSSLEASRDRSCGNTTLPRIFQGTFSAPIPWSRRPRRPPSVPPDGRFCPTPCPRPASTCRRRSTPVPSPELSAPRVQRRTRCSTATDPTQNPV